MDMSFDMTMFLVRLLGRIGFVFLMWQMYREYNLLASPLLRYRSRWFIRGFTLSLIISFILMISEFFVDFNGMPIITMAFGALTTYTLVLYLHYQNRILERNINNAEYAVYAAAMDDFIRSLKKDAHKK